METTENTITRSAFARLRPEVQSHIARAGAPRIIDDPPPAPIPLPPGAISRREFDALSQEDRLAIVKAGQPIVDFEGPRQ